MPSSAKLIYSARRNCFGFPKLNYFFDFRLLFLDMGCYYSVRLMSSDNCPLSASLKTDSQRFEMSVTMKSEAKIPWNKTGKLQIETKTRVTGRVFSHNVHWSANSRHLDRTLRCRVQLIEYSTHSKWKPKFLARKHVSRCRALKSKYSWERSGQLLPPEESKRSQTRDTPLLYAFSVQECT